MTKQCSPIRRIILSAGLLFLWVAGASAELSVSQNHENGVYAMGEKIVFTITGADETQPLNYRILLDGTLDPVQSGDIEIKDGSATVNYVPEKAGCITITVPGGQTAPTLGAVAAPFDIQPSLPEPEDFDVFWDGEKSELAAVPMNVRLTRVDNAEGMNYGPSVESFDLKADCLGGRPVSGYYVRPAGAKKGSLPALLNLHGAAVRSAGLRAATVGAKGNRLSLDINAHGLENGQPPEFYSALSSGELSGYHVKGLDTDPEHYYFLGMYLRVVRAIDFLTSQPEWDGETLILQGGSQGGGQSLVGAGLDPRVTEVNISVPAFCDLTGSVENRQPGWPIWRRTVTAEQRNTLRYFDACNFSPRIKAKVRMVVGLIDTTCSPIGNLAAYNRLPGEKTVIILPSRGHAGNAASTAREKEACFQHQPEK